MSVLNLFFLYFTNVAKNIKIAQIALNIKLHIYVKIKNGNSFEC